MVVFIGNLPKFAAEKDLCRLAQLAPDTPVRIVRKTDRHGQRRRYVLVPTRGEGHSKRLIRRLQGRRWLGATLVVREFRHRTAVNERRRVDWRRQPWASPERRCGERRARALSVTSLVA